MALHYHTHDGSSSLSEFRRTRLSKQSGAHIDAHYVHYVALYEPLSSVERASLDQLLSYDEVPQPRKLDSDKRVKHIFYVSPRTGTISPWSSKATSIAFVCGFGQKVKRIERGIVITVTSEQELGMIRPSFADELHDRMTQTFESIPPSLENMFAEHPAAPLQVVELGSDPHAALEAANKQSGLSLDASEIDYLAEAYGPNGLNRSPTDVELFMFAQVNSEHCRHKTFNAQWTIDGAVKPSTLFSMIRNTHKQNPDGTVSAYSDNAAVLDGPSGSFLAPDWYSNEWRHTKENMLTLIKVETHNHPTAVSPYPGAATGSGGEIRDEGAVGRGSRPKAGLSGFAVSDLLIPGFQQPWELSDVGKPDHIASARQIMLEAPIGSSDFNNEFGRPCITGYFRTLLTRLPIGGGQSELRGYHKPIMIAGGLGSVRPQLALKNEDSVNPEDYTIVLGGPAMLIGLGGGAASSVASGEGSVELDFASVQRANAEVQRRAQEVINTCSAMGLDSPIAFIHDVGAGGLSNALPELAHDSGYGATFELRDIDNADASLSPKEIFCCEAQERYVMAISRERMNTFEMVAKRERCGFSVVGKTTGSKKGENRLILMDRDSPQYPKPIDLPMSVLFGKPPKKTMVVETRQLQLPPFDASLGLYLPEVVDASDLLQEAVSRVLALPSVASKSFLITIADRSVGGLVVRDQFVGPWQIPVSNVGVTATSLTQGIRTGEAMALGEKPLTALVSAGASARMAIAEALTNLASADLSRGLERVRLSANWMSAVTHAGEGSALYEAVEAVDKLCTSIGISVPVGKDSMSMKMRWQDRDSKKAEEVTAPLSLVITAFAPIADFTRTWTPTLRRFEDVGETVLLFVDLAMGKKALGASALAQVFNQVGDTVPDLRDSELLRDYFDAIEQLHEAGMVLAYHDRSDGGLFTTLVEMMFAGRCGLEIMLDDLCSNASTQNIMETLFNEELGGVFQVRKKDETEFHRAFATCGPPKGLIRKIGRVPVQKKQELTIFHENQEVYRASRTYLQQRWASTSFQMQRLRDNPDCAEEEYSGISDNADPGLSYRLTFDPVENILPKLSSFMSTLSITNKPRVMILREQGINGAAEMAFAFMNAGFIAVDVHMSDIIEGRVTLDSFRGLAACGGFSYGDVLGAGQGWAKSVLLHPETRNQFRRFFERKDTFTLGVCNGCQFLSHVKSLIPGAAQFPSFAKNLSEQHEARVAMVEILDSSSRPSVFLHGMKGSMIPVSVSHGEGRASFSEEKGANNLLNEGLVSMQYVDNKGQAAGPKNYPWNPNGSDGGIAGVRSQDGRVMALMPHVERNTLAGVASYIPDGKLEEWKNKMPWNRVFESARRWVG